MTEIPPPSLAKEPESPEKSIFARVKKWSGLVGGIVALAGFVGTTWKTISYVNELHDTIKANKQEVTRLTALIDDDRAEQFERVGALADAIRAQRDRDRDVITNLRIAVAAIQASQQVRAGVASYAGVESLMDGAPWAAPVSSARTRQEQAEAAEDDATAALRRAGRIQEVDHLSALDGM